MADSLKRVAVITGAGRGIGRATAIEFSARGFAVVLVSRTRSQLDETAAMLAGPSLVCAGDVTDSALCAGVIEQTISTFGRVDALVNNAGLAPVKPVQETDDRTWHAVIDTNLSAAFYLARSAWPALMKSSGAVVNVGSEASRDPLPGFTAYAAAKAGLNALTLMLHREGREQGVRAYCVAPAATETAMFRQIATREQYPETNTLDPVAVARTIIACVDGDLQYASGEVIYVHRR